MKRMILSAVMSAFAVLCYAQATVVVAAPAAPAALAAPAAPAALAAPAASASEHNEWLTTFDAVIVNADLDINFVQVPDTQAPKIVYDTKGSYTTKFSADVKDKTLRITEKADSRRPERTQVTVYYNSLRTISLSGAVAKFEGTVEAVLLDLTVGGNASLTMTLDVKDLKMELTGGSNATISGKARYLSLYASTGKVNAAALEVMSAEVNAQTKADVSLWVTERFVGKTTTNARITYKGLPEIVRGGAKFMGGEIIRVEK